jgi:hypothetical protein
MVPYLTRYTNEPVLFLDCDMLCLANIGDLFDLYDPEYAVQVVKHDYQPSTQTKFLNNTQSKYTRKNWSSAILFNPSRCISLTPEYVNSASGMELHQFRWLEGDHEIGELPKGWNYLVGEANQCPIEDVKIAHYTLGTPCFDEYANCEFGNSWYLEKDDMLRCDQKVVP